MDCRQKGVSKVNELSTLPPYEAKSFMLWLAEATKAYFEDPDVKRKFEEWEKECQEKDGKI